MPGLDIVQIPVLNDNYIYVVHAPETEETAVVDPAVSGPVLELVAAKNWRITHILNTHHHGDHVGGNLEIKAHTGCTIVGPRADQGRIPGIDIALGDGDVFAFGATHAHVFDVPGHTRGHIAYWFSDDSALFCGDTLFALGCGRLFEGTPAQMWHSLNKFKTLPSDTKVYCAHEYTLANGMFAVTVEPNNPALSDRMKDIKARRAKNQPTVPSTIGEELMTNPFLRADTSDLAAELRLSTNDPVAIFAEVRSRKDHF